MSRRGPRRPSSILKKVGDRLRELREEKALSQAELARLSRTSASHINAVERGERAPTVVALEQFARGLDVPITELLGPAAKRRPPSRSEKVWFRIVDQLRDRDVDYLRAAEDLLRSLERAVSTATTRTRK